VRIELACQHSHHCHVFLKTLLYITNKTFSKMVAMVANRHNSHLNQWVAIVFAGIHGGKVLAVLTKIRVSLTSIVN
jgi:hypothetical protein